MSPPEQTKEQILSRVRDEIWKHTSEDVENVLKAMWDGLGALNVPLMFCSVNLIDDTAPPAGHRLLPQPRGSLAAPRISRRGRRPLMRIWKVGALAHRPDLERDAPYGEWEGFSPISIHAVADAPFAQGTLAISSKTPDVFSPQDLDVLQDMAQTISRGFQRLQDLQTLERRNQELEDEIAERQRRERREAARYQVREQVWNMDSVDDIDRVLETVGDILKSMEVPLAPCGVNIVDPATATPTVNYIMNQQGEWSSRTVDKGGSTIAHFWRQTEPVYRRDLHKENPYNEHARQHSLRRRRALFPRHPGGEQRNTRGLFGPRPRCFAGHLDLPVRGVHAQGGPAGATATKSAIGARGPRARKRARRPAPGAPASMGDEKRGRY